MRIYEYAKNKNISSKDVIDKLKSMNIEVSNHMTVINEATIQKLDNAYAPKTEVKKQPNTTQPESNKQKQAAPKQQGSKMTKFDSKSNSTKAPHQQDNRQKQTTMSTSGQKSNSNQAKPQNSPNNQAASNQQRPVSQTKPVNSHKINERQRDNDLMDDEKLVVAKPTKPVHKAGDSKKQVQQTQSKENKAFNKNKKQKGDK